MPGFDTGSVMYALNVDFTGSSLTSGSAQVLSDGQLLIGATATPNIRVGTLSSADASVTITNGAGTIDLKSNVPATVATTYTEDSGSATPALNIIKIFGGPGVTTSGAGNTVTINSVVFTDLGVLSTLTSDSGTFATAACTLNLPPGAAQGELIEVCCDTAGAIVVKPNAGQKVRVGSLISSVAGSATSTSIGDALRLRFRTSDSTWIAVSVIGTWVIA